MWLAILVLEGLAHVALVVETASAVASAIAPVVVVAVVATLLGVVELLLPIANIVN